MFYDAKKYYYKSVWEERNYDVLFNEFETGTDFANQILVNPKFNYLNVSAQTGISKKISDNSEFNISYILSQRAQIHQNCLVTDYIMPWRLLNTGT